VRSHIQVDKIKFYVYIIRKGIKRLSIMRLAGALAPTEYAAGAAVKMRLKIVCPA